MRGSRLIFPRQASSAFLKMARLSTFGEVIRADVKEFAHIIDREISREAGEIVHSECNLLNLQFL